MKQFFTAALLLANLAIAEEIKPVVALVEVDEEKKELLEKGVIDEKDILADQTSDITLLPEPIATTNEEAEKPPGKWTDEQKLTLETFKEIVANDTENVWVVAYIDPRCRDCLILSLEWEKLTQIEERTKRKIKLGYVDISVEENWKIVQDHTKGKVMTHTPAVTLYGQNKDRPHWYTKEDVPTAEGVHTWVSSYADHFGYGYWDPDSYEGTAVHGKHGHGYGGYADGYNRHGYGIGHREHFDSSRHEGALKEAGVAVGPYGKGYTTSGKYQKGDQITQLKTGKEGVVMRRRTVTTGGKLSGAAHDAPEHKIRQKPTYGRAYGGQYGAYGSYGKAGYGRAGYGQYGAYRGQYGGYGKAGYGGYDSYGRRVYGGYDRGYGGYGSNYGYDRYGRRVYGGYDRGYGDYNRGYGRGYGVYGGARYGGQAYRAGYAGYGGQRYGGYGGRSPVYGSKQGSYGYRGYQGQYRTKSPYALDGYESKAIGTYGNPYTSYNGPGLNHLKQAATRWNPKLGRGIVLGKYSKSTGDQKRVTDYDNRVIAGPNSKMYKDALDLAIRSGKGASSVHYGPDDAAKVLIKEDIPDQTEFKKDIVVPDAKEAAHDIKPVYKDVNPYK